MNKPSATMAMLACTTVCALMLLSCGQGRSSRSTEPGAEWGALKQAFLKNRFVAYTPSEYNPLKAQFKPATRDGIRADLEILKPFFNGLVTYSCNADQGVDQIVPIAATMGFQVILGIWDIHSVVELETAVRLARQYPRTVIAVIVGNETQLRGEKWENLEAAIGLVRAALPGVPISTSEPISAYGNQELRRIVDFHSPTCHWVFSGGDRRNAEAAVVWLRERIDALRSLQEGTKPILIKEHGFPAGPPPFNAETQAAYWRLVQEKLPSTETSALVFFEAFDLKWKPKTNPSEIAASEAHWGAWDDQRKQKPVAATFSKIAH